MFKVLECCCFEVVVYLIPRKKYLHMSVRGEATNAIRNPEAATKITLGKTVVKKLASVAEATEIRTIFFFFFLVFPEHMTKCDQCYRISMGWHLKPSYLFSNTGVVVPSDVNESQMSS